MTIANKATGGQGDNSSQPSFDQAWRDLRADDDIQFGELPVQPAAPPEPPPDWLLSFFDWLQNVFAPLGKSLVSAWPVLQWVLVAIGAALLLFILWRLFGPDLMSQRRPAAEQEDWTPDAIVALALLEEADRLAAEGRFDEATHLLLQRSVGQIAEARPDLVEKSSTAREIAAQPALPEKARNAFAVIADRVELSLFALRRLGADDWQAARTAYADFALAHHGQIYQEAQT